MFTYFMKYFLFVQFKAKTNFCNEFTFHFLSSDEKKAAKITDAVLRHLARTNEKFSH